MIGHSLLHHGPAFGAMAPWVYDVICGNESFEHIITLMDKDMIPRNAANATAIEFIEKLDNCASEEEVDTLLDKPEFMQVVNSSQWDPTECITLKVREKLITELIYDEIVRKTREQIKIKEDLQVVNFLKSVENWPELCKPCFVDGWQEISSEKLIDLFEPITPDGKAQEQTQKWFIQ